ncbi:MAG TPA: hypothetical protein VGG39_12630 [Polyangiaceae bacterium]|jgi:hypothetical protein
MKGGHGIVVALVAVAFCWSCGGSKTSSSAGADAGQDGTSPDGTVGCGGADASCCNGTACDNGLTCAAGVCVAPCGDSGEACCNGTACNAGLTCGGGTCNGASDDGGQEASSGSDAGSDAHVVDSGGTDAPPDAACGGLNEGCCGGATCNSGTVCAFGTCQTCAAVNCGYAGQTCCCSGTTCFQDQGCWQGVCQCGQPGNVCCTSFGESCNLTTTTCSDAGLCTYCGTAGAPCCANGFVSPCTASLKCEQDSGTCQ